MKLTQGKETAYIGTYTYDKSEGIYALDFNTETGSLGQIRLVAKLDNPSYLAVSKNNKYLYATSESDNFEGTPGGAVGAYFICKESGELNLINLKAACGNTPCHISIDSSNKYLFTANYKEGTVTDFSVNSDGSIGDIISEIRHKGCGLDTERQEKPHAHYAALTPEEDHLCVTDLGIDKIIVYSFDKKTGVLNHKENHDIKVKPGLGPRHMEFHPNRKFAYLINELKSDVVALEYSAIDSTFKQIQYISTLPKGYTNTNYCAAIHVSPDGKFLYASNRGYDSISAFHIDNITGKLTPISYTSTIGECPRDFAIHPNGKFLIAANQNSNNIVPFSINKDIGELSQSGDPVTVPNPTCIKFLQL